MSATPILEAIGLRKHFGGLAVADNVSLTLAPGERAALIGPNGAGKTTFIDLVAGNTKPSAGSVRIAGEDVTGLGVAARVRRGLVRSFQMTRLFPDMSPQEHVALAILQREGGTGRLFGDYRAMPALIEEAREVLDALGLLRLRDMRVREIAYGQQRLLEIALALALKPRILLLDEPSAGVPSAETARIEQALDRLPSNLAVLMIEHDMDLVFRFARRVIVLANGRVIFDGSPRDVTANSEVRRAYLGSYADARRSA